MPDLEKQDGRYELTIAGHSRRLFVHADCIGRSVCGEITDGVTFAFEGQGCWVLSLAELRELLRLGEASG